MKCSKNEFPVKKVNEILLRCEDLDSLKAESLRPECIESLIDKSEEEVLEGKSYISNMGRRVDSKVLRERYAFSQYVIDPNQFRLRKVVRVLALVMLFIRKLINKVRPQKDEVTVAEVSRIVVPKELSDGQYIVTTGSCFTVVNVADKVTELKCKPGMVVSLSDTDIEYALNYFFRKCTSEIKHFLDKKIYEKISQEKNGILYYTGRILPSQEFGGNLSLSDVMIDLTSSTFMVPLVDSSSPFAFSIVNEVHWFHPAAKHCGNETVLRYTMKYVLS